MKITYLLTPLLILASISFTQARSKQESASVAPAVDIDYLRDLKESARHFAGEAEQHAQKAANAAETAKEFAARAEKEFKNIQETLRKQTLLTLQPTSSEAPSGTK
jgi:ABC-type Fe3+-hydroxamate transport system substrate-binding protein